MKKLAIMLMLASGFTVWAGNVNVLSSGAFEKGFGGFKKVQTIKPAGRVKSTVIISGDQASGGSKSLKMELSSKTAEGGYLVHWLPVKTLKKWKKIRVRGKVRFEHVAPGSKGSVTFKIREWGGKYLGTACLIWLPFNGKGLRGVCKMEGRTFPQNHKEYIGKWLEFESVGTLRTDTTSVDFMIDSRVKGSAEIYIDDVTVEEVKAPVLELKKVPALIKAEQSVLPLEVVVSPPSGAKNIKLKTGLTCGGWKQERVFTLAAGNQTVNVPVTGMPSGKGELRLYVADGKGGMLFKTVRKIECIDDPFAD